MIGILDSGMGGLSTLAALAESGCDSAFCYYADTANAPYGNKPEAIVARCVERAAEALVKRGADKIILACNTATLVAKEVIRCTIKVPVYGVTPPVEEALKTGGNTLLLATAITCSHYPSERQFKTLSMPELATLVDRHYPDGEKIEAYCKDRLYRIGRVDNLVLGCTHYVLIKEMLKRISGAKTVLDGNDALVRLLPKSHGKREKWTVDFMCSGEMDEARYRRIAYGITLK